MHQDVAAVDVGAQLAGVLGTAQDLRHERADLRAEAAHALGAVWALEQQVLEAAVLGLHLHRALQEAAQRAPRLVGVGERVVEDAP